MELGDGDKVAGVARDGSIASLVFLETLACFALHGGDDLEGLGEAVEALVKGSGPGCFVVGHGVGDLLGVASRVSIPAKNGHWWRAACV